MTTFKTYKDFRGNYKSVTVYPLDKVLHIEIVTTKRNSGKLVTTATVMRTTSENTVSYFPCSDFSKTIISSNHKRCTEKVVTEQHKNVIENQLNDIVIEAVRHYKKTA
jgi:hypothetical protein